MPNARADRARKEARGSFRLTDEMVERLDAIAVREDLSRSAIARRFILDGLAARDAQEAAATAA